MRVSSVFARELEQVFQKYEAVIGMEIHCQLRTKAKLFAPSAVDSGAEPNENIDPVTLGLPGALPVLNRRCVELAARMGFCLGSQVNPLSVFARKNYFYPDLPKGYQITQYDKPICSGGELVLESGRVVRIDRIQIEEDAGKSVHGGGRSAIDFNRAGVGLIEIVTHPDLRTPAEVQGFVRELHRLAVYNRVSEGDMERGQFRADANVSLRPRGSAELGTRTELKNLNSFRFLERAVSLEIIRQADVLDSGEEVTLETRGYDSKRDLTYSQRSKETATDYRYFPDPDLPPLLLSEEELQKYQTDTPAPLARVWGKLKEEHQLNSQECDQLTTTHDMVEAYLLLVEGLKKATAKQAANYLLSQGQEKGFEVLQRVSAQEELRLWLVSALDCVAEGVVRMKVLAERAEEAFGSGKSFLDWLEEKGLTQQSDEAGLEQMVNDLLAEFPDQAASLAAGQSKLTSFFVGQAMKRSKGRINPQALTQLLLEKLKPS